MGFSEQCVLYWTVTMWLTHKQRKSGRGSGKNRQELSLQMPKEKEKCALMLQ